jgi:hypothetical protein
MTLPLPKPPLPTLAVTTTTLADTLTTLAVTTEK